MDIDERSRELANKLRLCTCIVCSREEPTDIEKIKSALIEVRREALEEAASGVKDAMNTGGPYAFVVSNAIRKLKEEV